MDFPFFYKTNCNFCQENGSVRNGKIYLCEDGILCVSLDKKPHAVDAIFPDDIESVHRTATDLLIRKQDGKDYLITSAHVQELAEQLSKSGWIAWEE
ncbi:MAG: hypothetical protein IJE09_04600 [Oscillospiraceae bacterium]|nr:hypothetical protein [Oscillospiraceae bacterium]